jgi:hypothetical protein
MFELEDEEPAPVRGWFIAGAAFCLFWNLMAIVGFIFILHRLWG